MTTLTIEDMNAILNMMDLATKAGGLAVAQQALPIAAKLQQMANEMQPTAADEQKEAA